MAEQKAVGKVKKKLWFPLIAPKMFSEQALGETIASDEKSLIGRTISQNLMSLTNDVKKQGTNIKFEVEGVDNGRAKTKVVGYEIIPSSIRRMVRRNNVKIDMSFTVKTSDNKIIRVKPLLLTKSETKRSIAAKIRRLAQEHIIKNIQSLPFEDVMNDLITHKFQNSLRDFIKKTYPLKVCEIRYVGIEKMPQQAEKEGAQR